MSQFFKRKNSLGILYLNRQKAELDEVFEVSKRINLPIGEVYGVQQVGPSKVIVKLMDHASDVFENTMKAYENQVLALQNRNVSVQIINLSLNKIVITIRNVPFEFPEYVLQSILSQYGQVYNIRTQTYTQGPLKGLFNGNKTALMTLRKAIPSSIVFEGVTFFISYRGQLRTCLKCGISGHFAAQCTANQWEVINKLNEADFPELKKRQAVSKENDDIEQVNANANGNNAKVGTTIDISDSDKRPGGEAHNIDIQDTQICDDPEKSGNTLPIEPSIQGGSGSQEEGRQNINSSPDGFHLSLDVAQVHVVQEMNEQSKNSDNTDTGNVSMDTGKVNDSGMYAAIVDKENSDNPSLVVGAESLEISVDNNEVDDSQTEMLDETGTMDEETVTEKLQEIDISEDIADPEDKETPQTNSSERRDDRPSKEIPRRTVGGRKNMKETTGKRVYPVRRKIKDMNKVTTDDSHCSLAKRKHSSVDVLLNDTVNLTKVKSKMSYCSKKSDDM